MIDVFNESVIAALLGACITGAGLVLAVYALIIPIFEKLFRDRILRLDKATSDYEAKKVEYEKLKVPGEKFVGALILAGLDEENRKNQKFSKIHAIWSFLNICFVRFFCRPRCNLAYGYSEFPN